MVEWVGYWYQIWRFYKSSICIIYNCILLCHYRGRTKCGRSNEKKRLSILRSSLDSLCIPLGIASQYSFHNSCQQALAILFCDLRSVRWNCIKADFNWDGLAWFITSAHIPHPRWETSKATKRLMMQATVAPKYTSQHRLQIHTVSAIWEVIMKTHATVAQPDNFVP